jgi:hypothetical protein
MHFFRCNFSFLDLSSFPGALTSVLEQMDARTKAYIATERRQFNGKVHCSEQRRTMPGVIFMCNLSQHVDMGAHTNAKWSYCTALFLFSSLFPCSAMLK